MINTMTNGSFEVKTGDGSYPSFDLLVSQLDEVKKVLDEAGLPYWELRSALRWLDEPETTRIVFYPTVDPRKAQEVLDRALPTG